MIYVYNVIGVGMNRERLTVVQVFGSYSTHHTDVSVTKRMFATLPKI